MHYSKEKRYNILFCLFLVFLFQSTSSLFGMNDRDDDERTVCTEDTEYYRGYQPRITGLEQAVYGASNISYLNRSLLFKMQPFAYLSEANNPYLTDDIKERVLSVSTTYNTYPFDLPRDDIVKTTFCFRDQEGSMPSDLFKDHQLVEELCNSGHIIVEGLVDLSSLSQLQGGLFNLHFWGEGAFLSLQSFSTNVLSHWSRNQFIELKGIDIAIPKIQEYQSDLISLLSSLLLKSPELETFSLRFAGLTSNECSQLFETLKAHNQKLKNIVLSFNELEDIVISKTGCITSAFSDFNHFPQLRYIDVRGNYFDGASTEYLREAVVRRIQQSRAGNEEIMSYPFLRIGLSSVEFRGATDYLGSINLDEPSLMIASQDTRDIFKCLFHHAESINTKFISTTFFVPYTPDRQLPYADLADQLLLIRYGKIEPRHVNLSNLRFHHSQLQCFGHGSGFAYFILKNIKNTNTLKSIFLNHTNLINGESSKIWHSLLIAHLKSIRTLKSLELSNNNLQNTSCLYRYFFEFNSLHDNGLSNLACFTGAITGIQNDLRTLSEYIKRTNLKYINMSGSTFEGKYTDQNISSIEEIIKAPMLQFLNLSHHDFSFEQYTQQQTGNFIKLLWDKILSSVPSIEIDQQTTPTDQDEKTSFCEDKTTSAHQAINSASQQSKEKAKDVLEEKSQSKPTTRKTWVLVNGNYQSREVAIDTKITTAESKKSCKSTVSTSSSSSSYTEAPNTQIAQKQNASTNALVLEKKSTPSSIKVKTIISSASSAPNILQTCIKPETLVPVRFLNLYQTVISIESLNKMRKAYTTSIADDELESIFSDRPPSTRVPIILLTVSKESQETLILGSAVSIYRLGQDLSSYDKSILQSLRRNGDLEDLFKVDAANDLYIDGTLRPEDIYSSTAQWLKHMQQRLNILALRQRGVEIQKDFSEIIGNFGTEKNKQTWTDYINRSYEPTETEQKLTQHFNQVRQLPLLANHKFRACIHLCCKHTPLKETHACLVLLSEEEQKYYFKKTCQKLFSEHLSQQSTPKALIYSDHKKLLRDKMLLEMKNDSIALFSN